MNILAKSPSLSVPEAKRLATERYAIDVSTCRTLPSERDQNFRLRDFDGNEFVLKVANATESNEILEGQNELLNHLSMASCPTPNVVASVDGRLIEQVIRQDQTHLVRLVTFLPGKPLAEIRFRSPELLFELGKCVAQVDQASIGFDHTSFHRDFHWTLRRRSK